VSSTLELEELELELEPQLVNVKEKQMAKVINSDGFTLSNITHPLLQRTCIDRWSFFLRSVKVFCSCNKDEMLARDAG
jgi:hypothetical protein